MTNTLGAFHLSSSNCLPHANIWIQGWFNECIYTPWDMVAFVIGLSSVCFWIVAQVPQFISNFVRQSAEALSPWFLAQWLAGDASNFLGCILTGDQLATETITAAYFILADCVILSQYLYYSFKGRKQPVGYGSDSDESLHKPPNGYYEAIHNNVAGQLEKLLDSTVPTVVSKPNAEGTNPQLNIVKPEMSQETKSTVMDFGKPIVQCKHASELKVADTAAKSKGRLQCCSCTTSRNNHSQWNTTSSPGHSTLQKHLRDCCFANDMRSNYKRVVGQYGLDHSIPLPKRKLRRHVLSLGKQYEGEDHHARKSRVKVAFCFTGLFILASFSWQSFSSVPDFRSAVPGRNEYVVLGRRSLKGLQEEHQGFSERNLLEISESASLWTRDIGFFFGWVSSMLYLSSRVSQILKNRSRKSVDGLSLGMICCAVMANLTYGVSILMLLTSWEDLYSKLPWLLGSLGTVSLDIIILMQAYFFSCWYGKIKNETMPLLKC